MTLYYVHQANAINGEHCVISMSCLQCEDPSKTTHIFASRTDGMEGIESGLTAAKPEFFRF